jgi:hypothetical protein
LTTIVSGWEVVDDDDAKEIESQGSMPTTPGISQMGGASLSGNLLKQRRSFR